MIWTGRKSGSIANLFIIFLLYASCKGKNDPPALRQSTAPIVDAIIVKPQTITNHIEVNGTVVANEYVELHPEASGRLIYLNVPEGKLVEAGTVIARVNDADLKAQIEKSRVLLSTAEKTEGRYRQLLAVNGINESDYDASVSAVNSYKADIEYTRALLDKTVLKAPFNGIVGLRQVSLGAYVSPSTLIATLQQLDKIKIDFTLPEEYTNDIKIGGQVEVQADADVLRHPHIKARILAVEPQVNQNTRNIKVRALLENAAAHPGAFVKVYVNAGEDKEALMVPTNCIIPDDKNKQLVLIRDGKAAFVNVKTGIRQTNNVEIITGIKDGDTVVVTGVLFVRPKNPVKLRKLYSIEQLAKNQ